MPMSSPQMTRMLGLVDCAIAVSFQLVRPTTRRFCNVSSTACTRAMLDLLQDLVNVEAGRLLPLREAPIPQSTLFIFAMRPWCSCCSVSSGAALNFA